MKKALLSVLVLIFCLNISAIAADPNSKESNDQSTKNNKSPWLYKYPMSVFTKTRSAKTVGKGHLSLALKIQEFDWDKRRFRDGKYRDLPNNDQKKRIATTFCAKYGWAKDHHIAIGVPMFLNNFDIGRKHNNSKGLGNVFIFEKWNFIKETDNCPAVAVDFWYYFPTGENKRCLGTNDGAYKITTEISKAYKDFSLHFNPGYGFGQGDRPDWSEINAAVLFNTSKKIIPAIEYNYFHKQKSGCRHDIIPGIIWKFAKGYSFKVGVVTNIASTEAYKDRVGFVTKIFYRF